MTNKFKSNFLLTLTVLFFISLTLQGAPAYSQAKKEPAAPIKKEISVQSLIEAKNYEQALKECRELSTAAEIEKRKIAYDNYAFLLESGTVKDLDHITSFYSSFDNIEAGSNLQPLFLLISHLDSKQKTKDAAKLLDKINAIYPSNDFYLSCAPVIFSKVGRYGEALEIIKSQLDKKPEADIEKRIKSQLIDVHLSSGKVDDALKVLEEEMQKYPQDDLYKDYLTLISQKSGAFDKTIPIIQKNLQGNSTDESSLKSLFYQSMRNDNFETALAEFERIAKEKPDDIAINTMVAELNLISGAYETASVLIDKLIKDLPQNTRAHWLKGRLLFDSQQYDKAYAYLKNYIDEFKEYAESKTHYYLALSCIKTGRIVEAVDNMKIELAKSTTANSKLLLREMEAAFFKEKMFITAVNFFTELSEKHPGDAELLSKIALFHYYNGNYKQAVEFGTKALEQNGDSFSTAYILAMAYSKSGDNKRALELFKACAQKAPEAVSTESFNNAVRQSASLIWPFAHQHLCYIHSALRCGEMNKVTEGLNGLFAFLADKTPPKFVVKDIQSINPFSVRPEYSLFESYEFFLKNSLTEEYYKNLEEKGEARALVNFFIKDPGVKKLYEQSLKSQFAGDINASLAFTMEALKIEPDNIFLLVRAASAGIAVNSYLMMPLSVKILSYKLPETGASDEEKVLKCCISAFKLGAKNALKNNLGNIAAIKKSISGFDNSEYKNTDQEGINELEADLKVLKQSKFNKMALMMESTLYYFKGDINKSKVPVFEYIKQEADLSTFIWFVTNLGGYFIL